MKKVSLAVAGVLALTVAVGVAVAAPYALFGEASIVAGGNPLNAAQLTSDASPGYAGVDFSPAAPVAWSSLTALSADYNVTDDGCGGGSPRVSLGVDTTNDGVADGYVHVSVGPPPTFTGCAAGWQPTGNLIGNADAGRYDYSQFGGSPFTTYANAPASVQAGSVTEAFIVVDGSWSAAATGGDGEQTVLVDNLTLNGDVVTFDTPTSAEQCKDGGWTSFSNPSFKNQGDCISFVATGGRNGASG